MASTYLYRTQVAGTSTQKFTFSAWVKRTGGLSDYSGLLNCYTGDANRNGIYFGSDTKLNVYFRTSSSSQIYYETSRRFRDITGYYHIVVAVDTTQSTAGDRVKIYVNGVEETNFGSSTNPGQNTNFSVIGTNNLDLEIGRMQYGSTNTKYFNGIMSHVHFTDGYVYTPSTFGETDTTTGEWKIKTNVTGVTYGNNGFFILKDDNSNLDRSGEGHNQTISGTLTKTEDNPSNVFATLNSLDSATSGTQNFSNGNTTFETNKQCRTTLGASSGKWYCEAKYVNNTSFSGIAQMDGANAYATNSIVLFGNNNGEIFVSNSATDTNVGAGTAIDNNSIIMFAMDLDNNRLYIGKNGSWWTDGAGFNSASLNSYKTITRVTGDSFGFKCSSGSGTSTTSWNFGNGFFGTTAITSAGSNGNGSLFEYDVPSGYYALNTKNINTYG